MVKWLDKILNRRAYSERTGQWLGDDVTGVGFKANPDNALQIDAVYTCVRILSESLAMLPIHLHQRVGERDSQIIRKHPVAKLFCEGPNPEIGSFSLIESSMISLQLRGNAYFYKQMDKAGRLAYLWMLPTDKISVGRSENNNLIYIYTPPPGKGEKRIFQRDEIAHIVGMSFNGVTGISPIEMAEATLNLSKVAEKYGSTVFTSGGRPPSYIKQTTKAFNNPEDMRKWAHDFAQHNESNPGRTAVLPYGMEFEKLSINPDEAQFLETRKFQRSQIFGLFRVPPHMGADLERSTNNNIEQQAREFVQYSLMPWIVRYEREFNRALLTEMEREEGYYIKFNVDALLRGTLLDRFNAYAIGKQWGFLNTNEIRGIEDLNGIGPDGEIYMQPLNMAPLGSDQEPTK